MNKDHEKYRPGECGNCGSHNIDQMEQEFFYGSGIITQCLSCDSYVAHYKSNYPGIVEASRILMYDHKNHMMKY